MLVGFGPVCADHYGLKAEWLSGVAKAEAKASVSAPKLSVQDEVIESLVALDEGTDEEAAIFAAADQAKNDDDKAQDAANHEVLQAELGPDYAATGLTQTCFFCEQETTGMEIVAWACGVCGVCGATEVRRSRQLIARAGEFTSPALALYRAL